jgi:hypothetical protein
MWIRRILVIPAVAALAVPGAVVLGAAGTASAATTAPAAQRAVTVIAQPAISNPAWVRYGLYDSQFLCEVEGSILIGVAYMGGQIVSYECTYEFGEGWVLLVFVEPVEPVCPAVVGAQPTAKVSPKPVIC